MAMTSEAIKKLAIEAFKSNVFFSSMIPKEESRLIPMIFMSLLFMSKEQLKELEGGNVALYEYYDQAGPRSINGYPIFMSMHTISIDDLKKVYETVEKLQKAADEL